MKIGARLLLIGCVLTAHVATAKPKDPKPVNVACDRAETIAEVLATLDKQGPNALLISGTCREYVHIEGFEHLTVEGLPGAALEQPATAPPPNVDSLLTVSASTDVTISGLTIRPGTMHTGLFIRAQSSDVRARSLIIDGGNFCILESDGSWASYAGLDLRPSGWAGIGLFHAGGQMEDTVIQGAEGGAGITLSHSHLTIHGTTIRNKWFGISAVAGSYLEVEDSNNYVPFGGPSEVLIENPANNSYWGVQVDTVSSAYLYGNAKLRITQAGGIWWTGGGVAVQNGSSFRDGQPGNLTASLEIENSQGQGLLVTNQSVAILAGSRIVGSVGNGLAVLNNSTVAASSSSPLTDISGSLVQDVFCDSRSLVTGAAGIANATKVQCSNLLSGDTDPSFVWR